MPATTILIVENHDALRTSLRDWLMMEFDQCRVIEASSAEAAIALIRTESPHVVIMDIRLPGMSGIEGTRQIKAALPKTQIVILTVCEGKSYRADAAAAGASAYVLKRTMRKELINTLSTLLANNHYQAEVSNACSQ